MKQMVPSFENKLAEHRIEITRKPLEVLQINVGKLCNQACHHCHVEAGPKRTEIMEKKTVDRLIELLDQSPTLHTVDVTGGAPELNPHFRYLVRETSKVLTRRIDPLPYPSPLGGGMKGGGMIDRCNLTVLFENGQEDTAQFLREYRVKVVASLPCYSKKNVDAQRGGGVFDKSIRALRLLNELGYGKNGSGLELDLVYNPLGACLPPSQEKLESDYKKELHALFGIEFNHLFTITNMPIKRFLDQLVRDNKYEEYMTLLVNSFNVSAAQNVMCRNLISIGWDGKIYDCDFNQMLEIPTGGKQEIIFRSPHVVILAKAGIQYFQKVLDPCLRRDDIMRGTRSTIWNIESFDQINESPIAFANHCYGCAAGAGSSCSGSLMHVIPA